eukprot:5344536-Pyramimonas_sp.AAC.1
MPNRRKHFVNAPSRHPELAQTFCEREVPQREQAQTFCERQLVFQASVPCGLTMAAQSLVVYSK